MNVLVRRYKRGNDKAALYIFANSQGEEVAYVYAEYIDGEDKIETMDSKLAANQLTHNLGINGFMPDGPQEVLDLWNLSASEELGDAPTGPAIDPFESKVETWNDEDIINEGDLPPQV